MLDVREHPWREEEPVVDVCLHADDGFVQCCLAHYRPAPLQAVVLDHASIWGVRHIVHHLTDCQAHPRGARKFRNQGSGLDDSRLRPLLWHIDKRKQRAVERVDDAFQCHTAGACQRQRANGAQKAHGGRHTETSRGRRVAVIGNNFFLSFFSVL